MWSFGFVSGNVLWWPRDLSRKTLNSTGDHTDWPDYILELFLPYTAYDLVAMSPDPPGAWHELQRCVQQEFSVNVRLCYVRSMPCTSVRMTYLLSCTWYLYVRTHLGFGACVCVYVRTRLRGRPCFNHPKRWKKLTIYGRSREEVALVLFWGPKDVLWTLSFHVSWIKRHVCASKLSVHWWLCPQPHIRMYVRT